MKRKDYQKIVKLLYVYSSAFFIYARNLTDEEFLSDEVTHPGSLKRLEEADKALNRLLAELKKHVTEIVQPYSLKRLEKADKLAAGLMTVLKKQLTQKVDK